MYGAKIPNSKKYGRYAWYTLMCMSLWMIDYACELNLNLNKIIS